MQGTSRSCWTRASSSARESKPALFRAHWDLQNLQSLSNPHGCPGENVISSAWCRAVIGPRAPRRLLTPIVVSTVTAMQDKTIVLHRTVCKTRPLGTTPSCWLDGRMLRARHRACQPGQRARYSKARLSPPVSMATCDRQRLKESCLLAFIHTMEMALLLAMFISVLPQLECRLIADRLDVGYRPSLRPNM